MGRGSPRLSLLNHLMRYGRYRLVCVCVCVCATNQRLARLSRRDATSHAGGVARDAARRRLPSPRRRRDVPAVHLVVVRRDVSSCRTRLPERRDEREPTFPLPCVGGEGREGRCAIVAAPAVVLCVRCWDDGGGRREILRRVGLVRDGNARAQRRRGEGDDHPHSADGALR